MKPVRTYEDTVHGQRCTVTVYPAEIPDYVPWVLSTVNHGIPGFSMDPDAQGDPVTDIDDAYEARLPGNSKRHPVDPADYEEEMIGGHSGKHWLEIQRYLGGAA